MFLNCFIDCFLVYNMMFKLSQYILKKYHTLCFNFLFPIFCAIFVIHFASTLFINLIMPCYYFYVKKSTVFKGITKEKNASFIFILYLLLWFFFFLSINPNFNLYHLHPNNLSLKFLTGEVLWK